MCSTGPDSRRNWPATNWPVVYDEEAAIFMIDLDKTSASAIGTGTRPGTTTPRTVTETISHRLRLSDIFARIGGDEFAVLLPHTSAEQALSWPIPWWTWSE